MAIAIFSLKIALISIGVLSSAVFLSSYLPATLEFILSELPVLWKSIRSWLTPPYLYFIINGIIITIVASSRYSQKKIDKDHQPTETIEPVKIPVDLHQNFSLTPMYRDDSVELKSTAEVQTESFLGYKPKEPDVEVSPEQHDVFVDYQMNNPAVVVKPEVEQVVKKEAYPAVAVLEPEVEVAQLKSNSKSGSLEEEEEEEEEEDDQFDVSESNFSLPNRTDSMEIFKEYSFGGEKPPISVRFGHQRRIVKPSTEGGKSLKVVLKPKRHETLENTWKMITEGRSIPLARHLKKSDTWETHTRAVPVNEQPQLMKKADTFNDHTNTNTTTTTTTTTNQSRSPPLNRSNGKLKKEPSLSQEELNRRVEAFINKFNEEMRLQRLESLKQYQEMIGHSGH